MVIKNGRSNPIFIPIADYEENEVDDDGDDSQNDGDSYVYYYETDNDDKVDE